jgi:predicted nucleic acid-binding protein
VSLPQSHAGFLEALSLFENRPDKHYSLTDCVSMNAMKTEGIPRVLSNDRHFSQKGFDVLIKKET